MKWLLVAASVAVGVMAPASARDVVFIIEEPYANPAAPPSDDQLNRAREAQVDLTRRVLQLQIDSHVSKSGLDAIKNNDAERFKKADLLVQVLLDVSKIGYSVEFQLYDRANSKWSTIPEDISKIILREPLADRIADALFPELLIRLPELAQPGKRVLFADCLAPTSNEPQLRQFARDLSVNYGNELKRTALQSKFVIVPLISTAQPKFFEWWCWDLQPTPRSGSRADTWMIYGFIDPPFDKPSLTVEIKKQGTRPLIRSIPSLKAGDPLKLIKKLMEGLANEM